MKIVLLISTFVLFAGSCFADAARAAGPEFHGDYSLMFVPPKHEPVIGDKVARYRAEIMPSVLWGDVEIAAKLTAWGVQPWERGAVGDPAQWADRDWEVEEWRYAYTLYGTYRINKHVGIYTEYYKPINSESWGRSYGNESNYSWLVGVRGRLF
jgi:hypothetical protein